ncbi:hypothetical protein ONZ51_g11919 [Trametes cubensis]|uniref:HNH nuclease domain-containing protein n=1 Tax=Trametes cubensis TaxID=1111947 RepID=A0AAD7TH86_9APHY|nr:hypothetical protein ONZ51_g11919 [Trametes cubensis]
MFPHLPRGLGGNGEIGGSTAYEYEAATVWTILKRFGYEDVCAELGSATQGTNFHRLENILTLGMSIHHLFGTLKIRFEAVEGQARIAAVIAYRAAT